MIPGPTRSLRGSPEVQAMRAALVNLIVSRCPGQEPGTFDREAIAAESRTASKGRRPQAAQSEGHQDGFAELTRAVGATCWSSHAVRQRYSQRYLGRKPHRFRN